PGAPQPGEPPAIRSAHNDRPCGRKGALTQPQGRMAQRRPTLVIQRDAVGLPASYRIGPARYAPDHESWTALSHTPLGLGERPFAPAQAVAARGADGWRLTWLRRTRIGGDTWEGADVPLGETREAYVVRVLSNSAVLREVEVTETVFDYTDAMAAADGATAPFDMDVAQLSETWGPGLRRSVRIDG
ncbi:MAG: hypothetical protein AAFV96_15370, partial [Pseudomonadota bacterium]